MGYLRIHKKAFSYIKGSGLAVLILLIIIIGGIGFNNWGPYIYGKLIDAITEKQETNFYYYFVFFIVISALSSGLSIVESNIALKLSTKICNKKQSYFFENIIRLKLSESEKYDYGSLVTRISSDISTIIDYDIMVITNSIFVVLNFTIPLIFIFRISIDLSFRAIIFLPVSTLIYLIFKSKNRDIFKKLQVFGGKYYTNLSNYIYNLKSIKSFKLERIIKNKYEDIMSESYKLEAKKINLNSFIDMLNQISNVLLTTILLYTAMQLILDGFITIGVIVSFNMYINKLFNSVNAIQKMQLDIQPVIVALDRLGSLENGQYDNYRESNNLRKQKRFEISVENVSYAYDSVKVLENITLKITEPGLYSIVGKNGSGKTTLINLIMDFYDLQSGTIRLNNYSYSELSSIDIRNVITFIPKEAFILLDSVLENIRLYNQSVSEEQVMQICKAVGLSSFFEMLPEGIHTSLRDREDILSSGMKQKLCFARALANPSPIIIFDEVTSDLDGSSEKLLIELIMQLSKKSIILSVSHKLNTIKNSKQIYLLSNGIIRQTGIYNELIANCSEFNELFRTADAD